MALMRIRQEDGSWAELPTIVGSDGKDGKSAYELAKEGGYAGTEEEFAAKLADEYSDKLLDITAAKVGRLYDNSIIEQVSGDVVTMADSSDLELAQLKLYGKTTQFTTTGKNLINVAEQFTFERYCTIECNIPAGMYEVSAAAVTSLGQNNPCMKFADSGVECEISSTGMNIVRLTQPETLIHLYANGNSYTASEGITATIKQLMISEEGGDYEPYTGGMPSPSPEYPQPLVSLGDGGSIETVVTGKNLFGLNDFEFDNAINTFAAKDGLITRTALQTFSSSNQLGPERVTGSVKNNAFAPGVYIMKLRDVVYSGFVVKPSGFYFNIELTDGTVVQMREGVPTLVNKPWKIVELRSATSDWPAKSYMRYRIQIEAAETATTYEPYTGQTLTAQTPNGLPGIPVTSGGNYTDANGQQRVCDEVDFARGVYVQRVGNYEFDGSEDEDWKALNSLGNGFFRVIMPSDFVANAELPIMSNFGHKGTVKGDAALGSVANGVWTYYNSTQGTTARTVYIKLGADVLLEEWKEELAKTPFRVISHLATPIETPLSAEEIAAFKALHSNKPNTTVYNDSGAGMSVEYIADTKTYIDNKFTELQNAILSAGANV